MSLLITRPRYDIPTHYLFHWSAGIIEEAKSARLQVFDLERGKANKRNVESYFKKQQPKLAVFNGHGNDTSITGQDGEVLVSANDNVELLRGSIIFVRACNAGTTLGPAAIKIGAKGFVGYRENFVLLSDNEKVGKPLDDEIASPFLECSNQVALSLIKGHSAKEAHMSSIKVYKRKIDEMLISTFANTHVLPFLYWNMMNQTYFEPPSSV